MTWRGIICFLGAIVALCNLIVIFAILRKSPLRTSSATFLIAGQGITDFFLSGWVFLYNMLEIFSSQENRLGSSPLRCTVVGFGLVLFALATMFHLVLIAYFRGVSALDLTTMPVRTALKGHLLAWLAAALAAIALTAGGKMVVQPMMMYCAPDWARLQLGLPVLVLIFVSTSYMCVKYTQIGRNVRKAEDAIKNHRNTENLHGRLTVMMATIVVLFVLCWTGEVVHISAQLAHRPNSPVLAGTAGMLVFLGTFLNPCVYAVLSPDMRYSAKRLVLRVLCCCFCCRKLPEKIDANLVELAQRERAGSDPQGWRSGQGSKEGEGDYHPGGLGLEISLDSGGGGSGGGGKGLTVPLGHRRAASHGSQMKVGTGAYYKKQQHAQRNKQRSLNSRNASLNSGGVVGGGRQSGQQSLQNRRHSRQNSKGGGGGLQSGQHSRQHSRVAALPSLPSPGHYHASSLASPHAFGMVVEFVASPRLPERSRATTEPPPFSYAAYVQERGPGGVEEGRGEDGEQSVASGLSGETLKIPPDGSLLPASSPRLEATSSVSASFSVVHDEISNAANMHLVSKMYDVGEREHEGSQSVGNSPGASPGHSPHASPVVSPTASPVVTWRMGKVTTPGTSLATSARATYNTMLNSSALDEEFTRQGGGEHEVTHDHLGRRSGALNSPIIIPDDLPYSEGPRSSTRGAVDRTSELPPPSPVSSNLRDSIASQSPGDNTRTILDGVERQQMEGHDRDRADTNRVMLTISPPSSGSTESQVVATGALSSRSQSTKGSPGTGSAFSRSQF